MSDFMNTIDIYGDDETAAAIIDKSIIEFADDSLTFVGYYAFLSCGALTKLNLPAATMLEQSAFESCGKLQYIELASIATMGQWAFSGCGIKSLVLRVEGKCPSVANLTLLNTPIASGTGFIYVPRAMVDSYKAATNWSVYAAQFRALEDYTVDGTITGELDETKI